MRWTVRILAALAIVWGAYFVWPYFAVYRLGDAIRARDVAAVRDKVNFTAVRRSLTDQMFRTYLQLTGREAKLGPFRELALAATSSIAEPIVSQLITSDALTDLLANGWPAKVLPAKLPGIEGLSSGSFGTAWQVFVNSEHGLRSFVMNFPPRAPQARQFGLQFRLSKGAWRLSGVELPEELRVRLTQELIRLVDKK